MDNKEFKKIFGAVAKKYNFKKIYTGRYKESHDSVVIIYLQKSNYGNYYQLNIKVFVHGVFGRRYTPNKDLLVSTGHVNSDETKEFKDVFDLENTVEDKIRYERIILLFKSHIVPFTNKTLVKSNILKLSENGEMFILPAVKDELIRL